MRLGEVVLLIVFQVAALAECAEIAFSVVGRILIEMCGRQNYLADAEEKLLPVDRAASLALSTSPNKADEIADLLPVGSVELFVFGLDGHWVICPEIQK